MNTFSIILDPRFKYKVAVYILDTKKQFHTFLKNNTVFKNHDSNAVGLFAGFVDGFYKKNAGILVFNKKNLDFPLLSHEANHAIFHFLKLLKKNRKKRANEEYHCYLTERLIYLIARKIKLSSKMKRSYNKEEFRWVGEQEGF